MNSFFKSKFFIVILIISLSLCIVPTTLTLMGQGSYVRGAVVTVLSPFQKLGSFIGNAIGGFGQYFSGYEELKAENEALRAENAELERQLYEASLHKKENEWLRGYLDLKRVNYSFSLSDAKIVGRETTNTRTVYTLDRGSVVGIKKNMPLITNDGVVGYITEVGLTWSKAVAITDDRSSVGVYSERSGAIGVLCGTYELSFEGKCEIIFSDPLADIAAGDKIYTSGLGGVYPAGLAVGEVSEVYTDSYDRSLHAIISPYVSFSDISAVMVVCDFSAEGVQE